MISILVAGVSAGVFAASATGSIKQRLILGTIFGVLIGTLHAMFIAG